MNTDFNVQLTGINAAIEYQSIQSLNAVSAIHQKIIKFQMIFMYVFPKGLLITFYFYKQSNKLKLGRRYL